MPDLRLSNLSWFLCHGLDWLSGNSHSDVMLKAALVSPYSLVAVLHFGLCILPPSLQHHLIVRDTGIAWWDIQKLMGPPIVITLFLPIHDNPMFPPSIEYKAYAIWKSKGFIKISSLFDSGTGQLKSFSTLSQEHSLPPHHAFYYLQLKEYVQSCGHTDITEKLHL